MTDKKREEIIEKITIRYTIMVKKSATLGMDNMLLFVTDSVFNCANAIEIS